MDNSYEYEDNFVYNGKPYNYYLEYKVKNHSSELQIFLLENDEISEFLKTCDEIKLWSWKKEYFNQGVMDGTQWELKIKKGGKLK